MGALGAIGALGALGGLIYAKKEIYKGIRKFRGQQKPSAYVNPKRRITQRSFASMNRDQQRSILSYRRRQVQTMESIYRSGSRRR